MGIAFWTGVKLGLDIVQSLVFTAATILGGIWALKTFGYDAKLAQLEKLNRSILNLKEAITTFHIWKLSESQIEGRRLIENSIFTAQAELRDNLNTSFRIDFLKRIEWDTRLLFYVHSLPSYFENDANYKASLEELTEVSIDVVSEGQLGMPKWIRSLTSQL